MKILKLIVTLFVLSSGLFAVNIHEAPSVNKRIKPDIGSGTIYSFHDVIKDAKKAVVNISIQKRVHARGRQMNPFMNDPFFRHFFGDRFGDMYPQDRIERALGSGVIFTPDGYLLTNNHVIEGADSIVVNMPGDNKEYKAELIGRDPKSDLAVIKIDAKNLPFLKIADSSEVMEGDVVFAIGNPFGVGSTVTKGIVSALNKSGIGINDYENFIQTDASINPGNSGGALIDSRGALIGINTAIISRSGSSSGIGFAIPSNMAKSIAMTLIDKGEVERGFMGVTIQDISEDLRDFYGRSNGSVIVSIAKDSPADQAGLKRGDLIIEVEGKEIRNSADLKNTIGTYQPGDKVKITYIRDGREKTVTAKLEKLPGDDERVRLSSSNNVLQGLEVSNMTRELQKEYRLHDDLQGVVVVGVERDSKAQEYGFAEGDVILQIENVRIQDINDLRGALKQYKNRNKRVFINRRGSDRILVIR